MRVINHIFLAAAAAALALVSCTKETTDNTENTQGQKSGVRTITVAFSKPDTRTSPTNVTGGIQPVWATGDQLTISNGQTKEKIIVPTEAVGKTTFTFTTELQGTINVYYPGGDSYNTYWDASGNVKISSTQSGEFAEANLCKGTVAEDGTNLTLTNQTALFQVTPPSGVKQFTITSLNSVKGGVARTGTAQPINTDGADAAAKLVITVGDNSAELGICYVALASGVNLSDLSFEYTTDATHGAMKGIPMKDIAEGNDAVTPGSVYTITANNWHEYIKVGSQKWATMNVGASSPTDYGKYFAWGDVTGQNATTNGAGAFATGFSWNNYPFVSYYYRDENANQGDGKETFTFTKYYNGTSGNKFTVYENCEQDDKTTLDLEDDAAFCNWGGAWRMPTEAEFDTLISGTSTSKSDFSNEVLTIKGTSLIFPAAGYGNDAELLSAGSIGYYWSSSLTTDFPYNANFLNFSSSILFTTRNHRYYGRSVRPVSVSN